MSAADSDALNCWSTRRHHPDRRFRRSPGDLIPGVLPAQGGTRRDRRERRSRALGRRPAVGTGRGARLTRVSGGAGAVCGAARDSGRGRRLDGARMVGQECGGSLAAMARRSGSALPRWPRRLSELDAVRSPRPRPPRQPAGEVIDAGDLRDSGPVGADGGHEWSKPTLTQVEGLRASWPRRRSPCRSRRIARRIAHGLHPDETAAGNWSMGVSVTGDEPVAKRRCTDPPRWARSASCTPTG